MTKIYPLLLLFFLSATATIAQCTTSDATGCRCLDSTQTDCDLLPDIEIAQPPFYVNSMYGMIEFSQTGNFDTTNNGKLRITLGAPNVGHGPLEIWTTDTFVCLTDTFYGAPPAICPDSVTYPKIVTKQRIYHKNANSMSYWERVAGSMSYHPSVGHMCIDNWGVFTLRTKTSDPNPLNWPIVGSGSKIAMCLSDYTNCTDPNYPGYCLDTTGKILSNVFDFPNYGLAGNSVTYSCSKIVEGISSGFVDIYWAFSPDQCLVIPAGTCNGDYYVVTQVDANNYFLEETKANNIFVIPITLTLQANCTNLVSENDAISPFSIYPNPVSQSAVISWQSAIGGNINITMINVLGEKVGRWQSEIKNPKSEIHLDVSSFPKGLYIVQLTEENKSYHCKLIKN